MRTDNIKPQNAEHPGKFVDARIIARRYSITTRYVHALAAQGRIPHLRLGRKCLRFDEAAVARALETKS